MEEERQAARDARYLPAKLANEKADKASVDRNLLT
jgi:hypothetical protein